MFGDGIMGRLSLVALLLLYFPDVYGDDPVIDLHPGQLYGTTMTTRNGRNISAFLGIPYAKPPVGPLRFRPTQLRRLAYNPENEGGIQAKVDGNICPQLNDDGAVIGDEDCLYLNVYAPQTSTPQVFPTMIYIHGGGFVRGSGSSTDAGPEYLMDRDIVLVTVNYRLGVLGFLSTGDEAAPGNFGLKDQVLAIQWVRKYILFFGGAFPMTIFGQGAGGASTSLHAISDLSQGLFDQYISQSGNSRSYWAVVDDTWRNYKQRARNLGKKLNCQMDNSRMLVKCLRNADVQSLVDSNDIFENHNVTFRMDTWTPTVENKRIPGAFLKDYPLHLMLTHGTKDCPAIVGNVHDEGLLFTTELYVNDTLYDTIVSDVRAFIKPIVKLFFASRGKVDAVKVFKNLFFNDTPPIDKELFIQNMTEFITDIGFRRPTEFLSRIMANTMESQIYFYNFNYRGTYSKTSATLGNNDDVGVTHGDDLTYLFPMKNADFEPSESDEKMIDIMVDFWTSFALTGTPTSQNLADPYVWTPFDDTTRQTLMIGKNSDPMDMHTYDEYDERLKIWDWLLGQEISEFLSLR